MRLADIDFSLYRQGTKAFCQKDGSNELCFCFVGAVAHFSGLAVRMRTLLDKDNFSWMPEQVLYLFEDFAGLNETEMVLITHRIMRMNDDGLSFNAILGKIPRQIFEVKNRRRVYLDFEPEGW